MLGNLLGDKLELMAHVTNAALLCSQVKVSSFAKAESTARCTGHHEFSCILSTSLNIATKGLTRVLLEVMSCAKLGSKSVENGFPERCNFTQSWYNITPHLWGFLGIYDRKSQSP